MELSKTVTEGTIVTKHGKKLIRCGHGRKPMGVWTYGGRRATVRLDGEKVITDMPAGVITWGPATVRVIDA